MSFTIHLNSKYNIHSINADDDKPNNINNPNICIPSFNMYYYTSLKAECQ